jgi:putative AdoMet-dependent methyltransferase
MPGMGPAGIGCSKCKCPATPRRRALYFHGMMTELFPREEFDDWAGTYDSSVTIDRFPFLGYQDVLAKVVEMAEPQAGMTVLDLGSGTGNLAERFSRLGCELWCTDFSSAMLAKARQKLPRAHFLLHDLRLALPVGWKRPFDRIVTAYVFHHFELGEKIRILHDLILHLAPGGRMLIGDIAFQDQAALEKIRLEAGADWEDEAYWLADAAIPAFQRMGMLAGYWQVSPCAGVFMIQHSPCH